MEKIEKTERFIIRPYSKSEFGMLYVPTLCNHILSPRQVRLIAEHLGEP